MGIYNIIEVANVHGGSVQYIKELLNEFREFIGNFGIKFQPFKYNEIALEDYGWYQDYQKLFISEDDWSLLIKEAKKTKDIWLDLFDSYSVKIFKQNFDLISGLKLQSSVLHNINLLKELSSIDISKLYLILNVSGYDFLHIDDIISKIESKLFPKETILQVGFQDYPTEVINSGLSKIEILIEKFHKRISFADHLSADSEDSVFIPIVASLLGASIIEKHVMHSSIDTKYDYYSSINFKKYKNYIDRLQHYVDGFNQTFVNEKEKLYLNKSLLVPILNKELFSGQLISIDHDFDYKRTSQNGLTRNEIQNLIRAFHVLSNNKAKDKVLKKEDFKKANIATIIACRLKSSRLPQKAIMKIGEISSIEMCIKNCLKFDNVNHTILATSTLKEDYPLKDYIYSQSVIFHQGDPEDVIERYLDIITQLRIDVIIRVTGDMPYVSNDIVQILLNSHFQSGSDFTYPTNASIGTNTQIITVNALRKVKQYFPLAKYSEYMTYYFLNNPEYFRITEVELPASLTRNYRLTLDYQEDLDMFNLIEKHFEENNLEYDIQSLFAFLDQNPEIANINKDCSLSYVTDHNLITLLKEKTTIKK